ncbi:hypothetical protein GDO86_013518 [Hymenochirus boettgeri]|uniref:Uncharacterized protein n=1 Tax=Hymenochirus boettgeri TaxID=247094 RepID=A0A8T2IX05_9PIPI|nr:hypothetical protein GDO86_013518 [Hymenochirus boettgeri]
MAGVCRIFFFTLVVSCLVQKDSCYVCENPSQEISQIFPLIDTFVNTAVEFVNDPESTKNAESFKDKSKECVCSIDSKTALMVGVSIQSGINMVTNGTLSKDDVIGILNSDPNDLLQTAEEYDDENVYSDEDKENLSGEETKD